LHADRNTVVTGSVFSHNNYGIVVGSEGGVLISGNSIYNNDKWGILGYGPLSSGYSNNVLYSNGSGSAKDIKDLGGNL
jgi:parallel beta-helix repeat protein